MKLLSSVAKTYVLTNLSQNLNIEEGKSSIDIKTTISEDNKSLTIDLAYYWEPFLLQHLGNNVLPIKVTVTANLAGIGKVA